MKSILALVFFLIGSVSHAKIQQIKLEILSYPSSALAHLDNVQNDIAQEAIKVCNGKDKVSGISDINIHIKVGIGEKKIVGTLEKGNQELFLWYPRINTSANVHCVE